MSYFTIENHIAEIPTKDYIRKYRNQGVIIEYCKSCPSYQNSWACPPFDYDPLSQILNYPYTYIIGSQVCFSQKFIEESKNGNIEEISRKVMEDVRAIIDPQLLRLEQTYAPALALYAGNCHLCLGMTCTRENQRPCRFPNLIRPSLEAYGYDLAKSTNQILGLELKWGKDGCLPPYFILVSGLMTTNKILTADCFTLETLIGKSSA